MDRRLVRVMTDFLALGPPGRKTWARTSDPLILPGRTQDLSKRTEKSVQTQLSINQRS